MHLDCAEIHKADATRGRLCATTTGSSPSPAVRGGEQSYFAVFTWCTPRKPLAKDSLYRA